MRDIAAVGGVLAMVLLTIIVGTICTANGLRLVDKTFPGFLLNERMAISNVGLYDWSGSEAGLRFPDKLLEVDSVAVSSPRQLEEIVRQKAVGTPVIYTVKRDDEIMKVELVTMRFAWLDLVMTYGMTFLAGIFYITIGSIVFALKPNNRVSWIFFFACFLLSLYSITNFDLVSTQYGFVRAIMLAQAFLPAAFLHFGLFFPRPSALVLRYPKIQIVPYVVSTLLVAPMEYLYPDPRFVTYWYLILVYLIVGGAGVVLPVLREFLKPSSSLARQRAKVVLFGAALALPLPALAYSSQTIFGSFLGFRLHGNLLGIPLLVFPASIAYSIAKHNLFDVDIYIKRAVGYGIMTGLVALSYFVLQTTLMTFILRPVLGAQTEQVFPIVFALLVVFFFNPINRRVQAGVDKVFFRKAYDYKETVMAVERALTSILDLRAIIARIIHTARERLFIDNAGLLVLDVGGQSAWSAFFVGDEETRNMKSHSSSAEIPSSDPLVKLVRRNKKLVTRYDIDEDPRYRNVRHMCRKRFEEWGASMALPLLFQNQVIGILLVGHKKSGKFYNREDVELLETLTAHGAVAIENARLAERMKREEVLRANLSRYASPQAVEQIVKRDVEINLSGERKLVTALFTDIRGFTGITGGRAPDQLMRILNDYFSEINGIIFQHQGSVEQYVGDAIMAVFGGLVELDNTAQNAVLAAVQMMEQMPALSARWEREYGFTLATGVGISTGNVLFGNIGSAERMELAVIGETVILASRFSGLAKAGQILVDKETASYLESPIRYKALPPTTVKGKTEKVEVFEIQYRARGVRNVQS